MRVLITGSNGFIGSSVASFFKEQLNWEVIGVGRKNKPKNNVDEYICCDLEKKDADSLLAPALKTCEAVIHLAADMRVEPHNVDVIRANCASTQRLLELCERCQIKVFLQLSSLPVIGKPKTVPIDENHPIHPPTVYHISKYTEELLAEYASEHTGLRTASFRISAPVGIGMKETTIFPTFIRNAVQNSDINIYGQGTRKQTYVHVDDIAKALANSVKYEAVRGVYNLSSYNCISNKDLAEKCITVLQSSSAINYVDRPGSADGEEWLVSIEKLKRDAKFEPIVTIEQCITELGEYYRRLLR